MWGSTARGLVVALSCAACDPGVQAVDTDDADTDAPVVSLTPLDPVAQAVRVSVSLRGFRPTLVELDAVRVDPDALNGLVDTWLTDPGFGATIRELYAEALLMRSVDLTFPQLGPHLRTPQRALMDAVSEEPLALIERVVTEGRPFSDIVTADTTVLDDVAARMWAGHAYETSVGGEQEVQWRDGRPAAGILSTNGLWARYPSNGTNYNRGRANLIASALLCEDFLGRDVPVSGDVDLSDPAAVATAVSTRPECVSCHQALDPLAAHLWIFDPVISPGSVALSEITGCTAWPLDQCYPFSPHLPDGGLAPTLLGLRKPGFYGAKTRNLADLGQAIAADPRFAQCTAKRFWSWFTQTPLDDVPFSITASLQRQFTDSGLDARALARAVVTHPEFLARDADDPAVAARLTGPLLLRPFQHARTLEALTGLRYARDTADLVCLTTGLTCYGSVELATDDVYGYRAMIGGIDGARVTRPTHTFTPVRLLFAAALAEEAAGDVVRHDLAPGATDRQLLTVGPTDTDEPVVRAQLVDLHAALYAEVLDARDAAIDADWALFADTLTRTRDPDTSWKVVLAAMLQSPELLTY